MTAKSANNRKKTNTSQRNRRNVQRTNAKKNTENREIRDEVLLILVLAAAVLLFLCHFGIIGPVGNMVSGAMFGLFGLIAYAVPVLVFFAVAFRIANKGVGIAMVKLAAGVFLCLLIGVILELAGGKVTSLAQFDVKELYAYGMEHKMGGGVICGSLAYALYHFLDMAGTVLVVLVAGIVCVVVITEKSFVRSVKSGSRKMYETAVEESDRRRDRAKRRREETKQRREEDNLRREQEEQERILRMDKKVAGVMLDTVIEKNSSAKEIKKEEREESRNDIHEITLQEEEGMGIEKIRIHTSNQMDIHEITLPEEELSPENVTKDTVFTEEKIVIHRQEDRPAKTETSDKGNETAPNTGTAPSAVTSSNEFKSAKRSDAGEKKKYVFPSLNLLQKGNGKGNQDTARQLRETAQRLQQTLKTFGVNVTITEISQGPSVTRYELQPEVGVKVSKIVGLADDIKLNLAATDIRIEAPIPGKAAVGIEVPNKENSMVALRELLESKEFKGFPSSLAFAVGKDIGGKTIVADIAKMPHMLIAGATGSGKSVCINTLIMSILYKASPEDVKLIMVDPKVVELSVYNGIPHLLVPVVTDPKKAAAALHWGVAEMTDRYKKFADHNVRDLKGYNKKVEGMKGEADAPAKMPQIVIIVDELADLMMVAPGEVEESICRLAQLARAAGIHLIIATQRPSVDVITGLIKANMPSRVAFAVSSGVDSRTILDMNGAEKLLGKGDMLFYPQGYPKPARIQGAFVSDKEVADVVDFLKNQAIGNIYSEDIEEKIQNIGGPGGSDSGPGSGAPERDAYFTEAGKFIIDKDKASIGMLQRMFKIGFNRAARIMDQLCEAGVVGEEEGTKPRKVLMSMEEFEQYIEDYV